MHRAALVVALATLSACASPRGGILGARALYDFGTVEQGASVQHQFPLKNAGRSWVRLEAPTSSCGCTVSDVDGKLLRPGQVGWVGVWLDTTGLSGKTTKTVTLRTTDPRTPTIQLALIGTVLTDLRVTPSTVYLGRIWRGDPARHEIVVSAGRPGKSEYTVSSVETSSSVLFAYVQPGDQPGQQKVVVEVDVNAPPGRVTDQLTIRTTSPRQSVITVPVFGDVV
ncbi:MAG TPA: DUF1573 domain-containing protein [Candidatus Binatia bacterium]|nr:DUF1573 domain-containing protein [Candidatus Binatia bacterium]